MDPFDASVIINWSDTPDARHQLPALVRQLVMATATVSEIEMPSGSSVQTGGWDGLVVAKSDNPWVPEGNSGWELSCNKDPRGKATSDYDKRTKDPRGEDTAKTTFVFVTSRRWPGKREWARERREQGPWADVRAFDVDNLMVWLEQAPEVAAKFAGVIGNGSPVLDEILETVKLQGERNDEAKHETIQHVDAGFAGLEARITNLLSASAALGESAEPEKYSDPDSRALAEKIDLARDLIDRNMVRSARVALEQIRNYGETAPVELEFRIVTNLAVCALADDDFDRARTLFEEAHALQPENSMAITNGALAAQLAKDPDRAVQLARQALEMEPGSSQATAILMQALWETGATAELENLIAAETWVTNDRHCVSILATIRQQQQRFEDATILHRFLIEGDTEDAYAHLALSQCLISWSQTDYALGRHTEELFSRLREAEDTASRAIELLRPTQLETQREHALVIRSCARALLGEQTEAMEDLDEALESSPKHPAAAFNKGLLLRSVGRVAEARAVLESIQDPERRANAVLPLAEACLALGDGAAAIELLKDDCQIDNPGWEDVQRAEVLCRAEALSIGASSVCSSLEVALGRDPDNPRLLTISGICHSIFEDPDNAERSFLRALEHAGERDRPQILARLGFYYQYQGRFSEAADCFSETVSHVTDPLAISLMICLANGKRLREALDWARKIKTAHRNAPRVAIEVEAEILGHIGDARAAVSCYQDLCGHPDATPADRITLAMAQLRCGDCEAARETVLGVDISQLRHAPQSMLQLAQIKWFLGTEGYLEDAYLARRCGVNDPAVHLGYVQLALSRERDLEEPRTVGPGCAVLLKSEGTETWWYILDCAEDVPGQHELAPNDGLAQRLLGRRAGESIVVPGVIESRHYEIAGVQSKFVRAFQETVEEFPTRFPEDMRLSTFKVEDDNLNNLTRFAGQRVKMVRVARDMYRDGRLPLTTLASLIGRTTFEVWRTHTREPSDRVWFGTGSAEETAGSGTILQDADNVVLDMVALLTVRELGIEEYLHRRFQRVAVPQQVVDELHATLFDMEQMAPAGYLGSDGDGVGMLTEVSEQAWVDRVEFVRSALALAESLERTASYRLLDTDDSATLFATLTPAGAGAVFAGDEHSAGGLLLVSDDLALSTVARDYWIDAVNTQAVLVELRLSNVITDEQYSSLIERLAQLNYRFVRVSADDILRSLNASGYATTDGAHAMFGTLRGPDCSEDSAVSVATDVVIALADKVEHGQMELILAMALASLRHGRMARPPLLMFRQMVASRLARHPKVRNQILRTVDAHINTSCLIV